MKGEAIARVRRQQETAFRNRLKDLHEEMAMANCLAMANMYNQQSPRLGQLIQVAESDPCPWWKFWR